MIGKLSVLGVSKAKPGKHADGGGLFVLVTPAGSKLWRMKYRIAGREKLLSFGSFPEVGLAEVRQRRDEARRLLRDGGDPVAERRARVRSDAATTFRQVADEWLAGERESLAAVTLAKTEWLLGLVPSLHDVSVAEVNAPRVLAALRKIEARGLRETASRAKIKVGQVLRFAVATGRAERDCTADLRGALKPKVVRNHAAVTDPRKVGELLRACWGYAGQPVTQAALRLSVYLFQRPGEMRTMQWNELDFAAALWRIPAVKTKLRRDHIVPLPPQALAILEELRPLTGHGTYVFPSLRGGSRSMSENTINAALRSLGISGEEQSAHGFRSTASTLLHELGWDSALIELQLAHVDKNTTRGVYNRAERLPDRAKMMVAYADYCDSLRYSGTVTPIATKARA